MAFDDDLRAFLEDLGRGGDPELETYALENRLIRGQPHAVTGLGRVFLQLRGKDAVRWLLTVEVAQSKGRRDPWRTGAELLAQGLTEEGIVELSPNSGGAPRFEFDFSTLQRLEQLEVLRSGLNHRTEICGRVTSEMREVVRQVLESGPWHAAAAALIEDDRPAVLQAPGPSASDAVIAQTRLIAHEVRNALIPVRHHLDALLAASEEQQRPRLSKSRSGVARVLEFVEQMVDTSELVSPPSTSFEVAAVIREAIALVEDGDRVRLELPPGPLQLYAPRARLLRAISNVVLNALQATPAGQPVRIKAYGGDAGIEVSIDDGGPGISDEHRSDVFRDGFTTRSGGSGFGLAYVRRVIEEELHGKVWCEASDLGGARFVLSLPPGKTER